METTRYPDPIMSEERTDQDLERLQAADEDREEALGALFDEHRRRLLRMVHLRMDPRLKGRIGASDVLQEAYVEIARRVDEYLANPRMPFFLWVRFITAQRLVALHRHHVGAKMRDVRRQVSRGKAPFPSATSIALVDHLMGQGTSPTQAMLEGEMRLRIEAALDRMNEMDREVLVLRHFEELNNVETAHELGIDQSAASKRYMRALKRLREILIEVGFDTGDAPS